VAQVPVSASIPRQPDTLIGNYTDGGTEWRVLFWIPAYPRMAVTRYEVQRNVLRNLYYAGIDVLHAKMGMFSPRRVAASHDEERENIDFLHGITPLAPLTTEELDEIAKKMRRHLCIAGQPVVREGEEGDSLFVVKEGTLEASITGESGISWLTKPGNVF